MDPLNISLEDENNLHLNALASHKFIQVCSLEVLWSISNCKTTHEEWTKLEKTYGELNIL
jgi:hypothetical protein